MSQFNQDFISRNNLRPGDANALVPSARDRHTAVVYNKTFYIFGGFDGNTRKNDFYGYNFETGVWFAVAVSTGVFSTIQPYGVDDITL